MNSLKIARTALRARPAALKAPLQRRGYADAVSDKVGTWNSRLQTLLTSTDQIELGPTSSGMYCYSYRHLDCKISGDDGLGNEVGGDITMPYKESLGTSIDGLLLQAIYKSQDVIQVNIPAESGEMGVLANHVPSIEQLKPGLIEVIEESGGSKQFFCTFT